MTTKKKVPSARLVALEALDKLIKELDTKKVDLEGDIESIEEQLEMLYDAKHAVEDL